MSPLSHQNLGNHVILFCILLSSICSAQVTIKERIAVAPRTLSSVSKTLEGDSTLIVRLEWDLKNPTPGAAVRFVTSEGSTLLSEGLDYMVHSVPYSPSGLYIFYIWHYRWPDSVHVTVRLQKANEPELQYFFAIGPYSGWGIPPGASMHLGEFWEGGKPFTTPFARWFSLDLGRESIYPWETNSFRITGRIDTSTAIRWYPSVDSVTLRITSGAETGSFWGRDNAPLGTSVTMLAGDIGSLVFVAGGPGSAGGTVTVEGKSKGILETKEFKVLPFVGSRLKLHIVSPMPFGEGRYFRVEILDASGTVVPMPPGITFTYKIFEGTQWCTLYDEYSDRRDSIIAGAVSNMSLYALDTARYDDKRVRLCATADGYQLTPDTAEVVIIPGNLKLRVTPQGSLKYGQSALIEAEGIYRNGELWPVYPGILYTYEIVESPDAGYLTAEEDTTHLDLRTDIGPVAMFNAREENPQGDSVRVVVKVIAKQEVGETRMDGVGPNRPKAPPVLGLLRSRNTRQQGFTEDIGVARIFVKKLTLKILDHAPWTIWPNLPSQTNWESRGADRPGYIAKRNFRIQVLDPSKMPVKGEEVEIFTTYEQGSGGHGHDDGDKALPPDKQGVFYVEGQSGNPLRRMTDPKGMVEIDSLITSQVSGKYLVTARLKADTTTQDTVKLEVRVPWLTQFRDSEYWDLRGSTGNHSSNHWCTPAAGDSLESALRAFYNWSLDEEGGGVALVVQINDMSLEWGGVFDIWGKWDLIRQHSFHRVGLSVDINRNPGNLRNDDGSLTSKGRKLKDLIEARGGVKYPEETIHYGFDQGK